MLRRAVYLIAIASLLSHTGASAAAQTQEKKADKDQVLRLKTELFELHAVVTDKQGKLVDNLKAEDFELLENNRPQRIEFLSKERLPERAASQPTPSRAPDANPMRSSNAPGRTVAIFVDTLHLSRESLLRAKQTLRQFIREQLTDNDLAAVIVSAGQMGLFNQFTRDRRLLLYAVDKLEVGGQAVPRNFTPYLSAEIIRGNSEAMKVGIEILRLEELTADGSGLPERMEPIVRARASGILAQAEYWRKTMLGTLRETIKRLGDYPGQRIVALVTDGFTLSNGSGVYDSDEVNKIVSRANASGVVIYSLMAKGLEPPLLSDPSRRTPTSQQFMSYYSASEKDLEQGMNALAKNTGGDAFFHSNDLKGMLKKVLDDNAVYYSLAYYPQTESKGKDRFNKLTLRVKDHPEYTVRAQKGYFTSDIRPEPEKAVIGGQRRLVDAMYAPLPTTAIGMAAVADHFETDLDQMQATVKVHIDANTLQYNHLYDKYSFDLDVVVFIFDASGKIAKTVSNQVHGGLSPERLEVAKQNGLLYTTRVELRPGVYQVRAGVREIGPERVGTAMTLLEIPDLKNNKLALSNLFITEAAPARARAQSDKEGILDIRNPTIKRGMPVFKMDADVVCSFMAYNVPQGEADSEVTMQVSLVRDGQMIYESKWEPLKTHLLAQDTKGMLVGVQLNLSAAPGIYELQIAAKDSRSKKPVQQSTLLEIVK